MVLSSIFFDDKFIEKWNELYVLKSSTFRSSSFITVDQQLP